jgi:aryl-phospho-beta-D-glucosidase BglC (GH1 family)
MDMLQVQGGRIVDGRGDTVRLRGTCVGGWMNGEDFIDGYPGCEHGLRSTMSEIIGPSKAHFFFERLLDYFFGEDDVAFIKSTGANVVRLPLNYRHFEKDGDPFHYLEDGFRRLDQAITWCAHAGLYVILDLHAVQGWQNPDWHCDNASRHVLFWQQKQFQDRFVALWEEFARRYYGNPTVAGFNVMNEPVTGAPRGRFGVPYVPDWPAINDVYRRVVSAIRDIDPQHIIFLEGDLFSSRFEGLEEPFAPNLVYSSHNYNGAGFGPGAYPGQIGGVQWDPEAQNRIFQQHSGAAFARQHNVPLWVGEFGAAYNGPAAETPDRLRALDDQIAVFEEGGASWTTWTYKDIDVMGWVQLAPDAEYLRVVGPVLEAKRQMATDFWMKWLPATPLKQDIFGLADKVLELSGDTEVDPADNRTYLAQATLSGYAALLLQRGYARCFAGMPEVEIDRVLQSFAFKNCRLHPLVKVVKKHMK